MSVIQLSTGWICRALPGFCSWFSVSSALNRSSCREKKREQSKCLGLYGMENVRKVPSSATAMIALYLLTVFINCLFSSYRSILTMMVSLSIHLL